MSGNQAMAHRKSPLLHRKMRLSDRKSEPFFVPAGLFLSLSARFSVQVPAVSGRGLPDPSAHGLQPHGPPFFRPVR
jgi:hypothetical protein